MMVSHTFGLYTQRDNKNEGLYCKNQQKHTMDRNFLWMDVKGQRIDLDTISESLLLNDSIKHLSLLHYLACDKEKVKQ